MENLDLYNHFRLVPEEAKKEIVAGRLKGMTDINPMWRIKALTEKFGPCGIGWYIKTLEQWIAPGSDGVQVAFCNINLYIKIDNQWSEPIFGTGGSMFVAKESKGLYTSDECYKMAYTDAISVACKSLGIGADVYWSKDNTKYSNARNENSLDKKKQEELMDLIVKSNSELKNVLTAYKVSHIGNMTDVQYENCKKMLEKKLK